MLPTTGPARLPAYTADSPGQHWFPQAYGLRTGYAMRRVAAHEKHWRARLNIERAKLFQMLALARPQLTLAKITDNLALQRIRPALRNPRQGMTTSPKYSNGSSRTSTAKETWPSTASKYAERICTRFQRLSRS